MAKAEHYKKKQKRDKISELLRFMKEHNFVTFSETKAFLNVSNVTLSEYLRQLLDDEKIIRCYLKQEGQKKRKKGYQLRTESLPSINSQIGKYEAIKFIEEMAEPIYSYSEGKDHRTATAVFADSSFKPTKLIQALADRYSNFVTGYMEKTRVSHTFPVKTAFVIMFQAKEELKT